LHEAFNQKEKGEKRKLVVQNANNNKDVKKSKNIDKNLRNKAVVPYRNYL
jgi:hypothetical protein